MMLAGYRTRKTFLQQASILTVAFLMFGGTGCNQARSLSRSEERKNVSWKTAIVNESERGEPLVISGRILAPDGRTPLEGMTLYVYQTDAERGVHDLRRR